jgi:hypothetical protein
MIAMALLGKCFYIISLVLEESVYLDCFIGISVLMGRTLLELAQSNRMKVLLSNFIIIE